MFVIVPWSQKNACWVGRPVLELAVEFVNDHPTTKSLRSLLQPPVGKESAPPKVPRSCITPFLQMNFCGSISAVPEPPVAQPRALIEVAWLKFTPGSVPRSVRNPSCHRKPWSRKQSGLRQFGALGSCIEVSAPPTTTTGLLMNWAYSVLSTFP